MTGGGFGGCTVTLLKQVSLKYRTTHAKDETFEMTVISYIYGSRAV